MRIIFLDIEGVLTNNESARKKYEHWQKYKTIISEIDEETVKRLAKIVRATNAKVVLTSSLRGAWRNGTHNLEREQSRQIQQMFDKYDIEVVGITPCIPKSDNPDESELSWRENEIMYYLDTHDEIESFCVIDDEIYRLQSLHSYLVLTNSEYGLEVEHVEMAIKILSTKNINKEGFKTIMKDIFFKIRQAESPELSTLNKERHMTYRNYTKMVKDIYDYAKTVLDNVFEQGYTLPIDIITLAEKLGFAISIEDLKKMEKEYFSEGHDCRPIAQLRMRKQQFGKDGDKIRGIILVANYLSGYSIRFSVAQQLGLFALREQGRIGLNVKFEATAGLYPLVNADEMLADIFAYGLMLPYHLFVSARKNYEKDRCHWPLDYADWIEYIRDEAAIPEYHAVLACQELNKLSIYMKNEESEKKLREKLCELMIVNSEEQQASLELYARTINNLESWGYPKKQIAEFLFEDNINIIDYLQDYFLINNINDTVIRDDYPYILTSQIINILSEKVEISIEGISRITGLSVDRISKEVPSRSLTKK